MLHGVVVIAATLKDPGFDSYQGVASLTVTAKAGVMYLPRYSNCGRIMVKLAVFM